MIRDGRILCINPRCRRTASAEKHPDWDEIICYQCWKATPKEFRDRDKQLHKRWKFVDRRLTKNPDPAAGKVIFAALSKAFRENWCKIRAYWTAPDPNSVPEGLESFLREMGLQ